MKEGWTFSVPFYAITSFSQPSRGHVIIRGVFFPHLPEVDPLKF